MGFFDKLFTKKEKKPQVEDRNFFNIKTGDIITYDLEDYQVVGKLSYNDHGFQWFAYQLQGENKMIWLAVEMDDELELGIYEKVNLKLEEPIPKKLVYKDTTFYLDESGIANVSGEGRSSNIKDMQMKYFDFCSNDEENFLSVEIWGNEIEVSKGYEIDDFEIKILAGS